MTTFRYTARDTSGQEQSGTLSAESHDAAVRLLRRGGLLPLRVEPTRAAGWTSSGFNFNPLEYLPMRPADVEKAFHQLAVMLRSGVSLLSALEIASGEMRPGERRVWNRVKQRINGGEALSEALSEHRVFPEMIVQLVKVGEQTGHLEDVLDQAAVEIQRRRQLRAQLVSALAYPSVVLVFAVGVTVFMLTSVVPELRKFLNVMGSKMPPVTQALIDTSALLERHTPVVLLVAVATVGGLLLVYQWAPARYEVDRLALRLPVVGRILRLSATVVFSRALGTLLRAGVRILDALETVERLHVNRYLSHAVARTRRRVMQGSTLAEPLGDESAYMPLLAQMVVVGENSGTLDDMLDEMARFHEGLLQARIRRLAAMMAPAVTIVVGGIVGFVYAAFLVAMFSAAGGSPR